MEIKKFDVMWRNVKVGIFYEIYNEKRVLEIRLLEDVLATVQKEQVGAEHPLFKLVLRADYNGYINNEGVRLFISFRVMPKNRMGCDKVLRQLGLSEYDQYAIFKKNNGACTKDDLWVNFNGVRYEDFHPRALYTDGEEKEKLLRLKEM